MAVVFSRPKNPLNKCIFIIEESDRGPKEVLDNKAGTFLLLDKNTGEIIFTTPGPVTLNRLVIQEAIATHSERVEIHALDAWINNEWKEIASATNIGYKRILRFPEVTTNKLRFRILQSRLQPAISHVSAHYYHTRPPQLNFIRDKNGMVTIAPRQQEFNWKPHGENAAGNLNAGFEIYYTADGSEPGTSPSKYEKPLKMGPGELKAFSVMGNTKGAIHSEQFGIIKKDWRLVTVSSERKNHAASQAFDANPLSYWQSEDGQSPPTIAIDLGAEFTLKGVAYSPQKNLPNAMMAKGLVQISNDGKTWKNVENIEFGNLVNNPTRRTHFFKTPHKTRYVKIEAAGITGNGKSLAIAELDFL